MQSSLLVFISELLNAQDFWVLVLKVMSLNKLLSIFSAFEFSNHLEIIGVIQVAVDKTLLAADLYNDVEKTLAHLNTSKDYLLL